MSKVFEQTMDDIARLSGCDWDFVVDLYNHIWRKHKDFNLTRFISGVVGYDWSARGVDRFKYVLENLCERSGYAYSYLFELLADSVYDLDDDGDWNYFVGVTMEHDW